MDKLPGSPGACKARAVVEHTRKPGLRGRSLRRSPLGSRAPRGEDTSEPVPRPLPGTSGAVRSANGRFATPISLPNRSLFTSIGDSNPCPLRAMDKFPGLPPPLRTRVVKEDLRRKHAYPSRRRKEGASPNSKPEARFSKLKCFLGSLKKLRIYNLLIM